MRLQHQARRLLAVAALAGSLGSGGIVSARNLNRPTSDTATPIKHVVVIFQENVSFDHYFGTYPIASNPPGEPAFEASPATPPVNGLNANLLTNNPNLANPFRLDRAQAVTCDQGHAYTAEQKAYDAGLVDRFVQNTGCSGSPATVMGYYDGNTVTALWNYAQHFAMSDNSFSDTFGPSTPGALNLISGQTHGASTVRSASKNVSSGTDIGDLDPAYDDCSTGSPTAALLSMSGQTVGDLLNAKGITWGWFQGGFAPTATTNGKAVCGATSAGLAGPTADYIPHHEPFQYYPSTANPHHLPPTSVAMIGHTDQASHQYDLADFWRAANAGNLPAVSYLKAKAYQDGHAGYSDPLDEQAFLVDTINRLQRLPTWRDTAIIIAYDDSDGWYDHAMPPIVSQSNDPNDALTGAGSCGMAKAGADEARCGDGPRQPLLVISPFARANFVDHAITSQASILRFVEDNWGLGRIGDQSFDAVAGPLNTMFDFGRAGDDAGSRLFLDPATGEPAR